MSQIRAISDEEVALIRAMIDRGLEKTTIQAYFTHPNRPVNFGRITNIQQGEYGRGIPAASPEELDRFLAKWNEARGTAVESVVATARDLADLPPTDPRKIASFFHRKKTGWHLIGRETDVIECKRSFSFGSKTFRAIAALANNRGGHILFGVAEEDHLVVDLQNSKFQDLDPSRFSQSIRSSMEPMPRIEIANCAIGGMSVGVLYVHRELDGPIIASKTDQEFREGTIYYRYPGESRAIGAAEFRKLLSERDGRVRRDSSVRIARLMELGPRASLVDLGSGGPEATKIVREGIDEADVLRSFVRQEKVEFPLAYLLRSCSTARSWLPVFYYLKLSSIPILEAIEMVQNRETSYVARKRDLLARLRGEKTARTHATGRVKECQKKLLAGDFTPPADSKAAGDLALSITSLPDARVDFATLIALFAQLIEVIRHDKGAKVDIWSYVYKAAARIDELYFKPAPSFVNFVDE